jgi:hypothetical protein
MGCSRLLFNICTATNVCNITYIMYVPRQSPSNNTKHSFTTFDILFTQRVVFTLFLLQVIIAFLKSESQFHKFRCKELYLQLLER